MKPWSRAKRQRHLALARLLDRWAARIRARVKATTPARARTGEGAGGVSRSGYYDDGDCDSTEDFLRMCAWTGNVRRHLGGRRGQAFLWELYQALEALPQHELITGALVDRTGACCSLGAVAVARGVPVPEELGVAAFDEFGAVLEDSDFYDAASGLLDIHEMMAREVMYQNDDCDEFHYVPGPPSDRYGSAPRREETPAERWQRMREWVVGRLRGVP